MPAGHLPIEAYMLTPLQAAEYDWVSHQATRACMVKFGFDYRATPQRPTEQTATQYSLLYRRYGVTDPAVAHQWGYHMPGSTVTPTAQKSDPPATISGYPPDGQTVLTGVDPRTGKPAGTINGHPVPKGGCLAEPDRLMNGIGGEVQGPGASLGGVVSEIKAKSYTDSTSDPRVKAAFQAWSQCMTAHGYTLTDPMSAPGVIAPAKAATPQEIVQAQADVACKTETNLPGIWLGVESELQNAAIAQHHDELAKIRSQLTTETKTLDQLLNKNWN